MATQDEIVAAALTKLSALIETPQVDYVEGDVEVKAGQKLDQLLKAIETLSKNPVASIKTVGFDFRVSNFGENLTTYED